MPKIFGIEHIIFLAVSIPAIVAGLILVKKKVQSDRAVRILTVIMAAAQLVWLVLNRASVAFMKEKSAIYLIPNTFCGTASLTLPLAMLFLKKDNFVYHSLAYLGLLGGVITMVYPDFIGQDASVFYLPTLSGLMHHALMVFNVLMLYVTAQCRPTIKKYHYLPLALCVVMTVGLAEIEVIGFPTAMEIGGEFIPGTGLTWEVVGVMFLALHFISLFALALYRKKKGESFN
ncbi:MAG: YwaF family protein [Clostridia bacterium]|nr:YwaF family protein [Clostridia bacterium]MBQ9482005.1 YwaF family protein [Clostridia bacterium]